MNWFIWSAITFACLDSVDTISPPIQVGVPRKVDVVQQYYDQLEWYKRWDLAVKKTLENSEKDN